MLKKSAISLISYDASYLPKSIASYYDYVDEIVLGLDNFDLYDGRRHLQRLNSDGSFDFTFNEINKTGSGLHLYVLDLLKNRTKNLDVLQKKITEKNLVD